MSHLNGVGASTGRVVTRRHPANDHDDIKVLPVMEKTLEIRKHYAGSVTIKENRSKVKRQASGMKKTNKTRKMEIYESVFEEGKSNRKQSLKARKSLPGAELDWSRHGLRHFVKLAHLKKFESLTNLEDQ